MADFTGCRRRLPADLGSGPSFSLSCAFRIVALNDVAEQHCVEIFLVGFYSQHPVEACDLRKPAGFPVFFKCLLDSQAFFGRKWIIRGFCNVIAVAAINASAIRRLWLKKY